MVGLAAGIATIVGALIGYPKMRAEAKLGTANAAKAATDMLAGVITTMQARLDEAEEERARILARVVAAEKRAEAAEGEARELRYRVRKLEVECEDLKRTTTGF